MYIYSYAHAVLAVPPPPPAHCSDPADVGLVSALPGLRRLAAKRRAELRLFEDLAREVCVCGGGAVQCYCSTAVDAVLQYCGSQQLGARLLLPLVEEFLFAPKPSRSFASEPGAKWRGTGDLACQER